MAAARQKICRNLERTRKLKLAYGRREAHTGERVGAGFGEIDEECGVARCRNPSSQRRFVS